MKAFEWVNPTGIAEAVQSLATPSPQADVDESPRPIAGGQDLLTTMKDYITRPVRLVNLKNIRGLDRVDGDAKKGLTIGALVTLSQLEEHPTVRASFPGLAEAAHSVATPQ
ncbi:MAG TPA: FAD binding domain-containing protein, partial [Pyrinomonadaceae bacterium]